MRLWELVRMLWWLQRHRWGLPARSLSPGVQVGGRSLRYVAVREMAACGHLSLYIVPVEHSSTNDT